jgi:leucyl aminopeptidase (aminopeptidase T)
MVPLMEAVAMEVQMAGGKPNMFLESDRVGRSFYKDVPDKYLEIEPRYFADWLKHTDVWIGLPTSEDSKALIEGIPMERMVKAAQAGSFFADVMNSLPVREVDLDLPTKSAAENSGMDLAKYQEVMFSGINADYDAISAKGMRLQSMLKAAKQIRITTPSGTDITFSMAPGRGIFLDDGMVTANEAKATTFTERYVLLPGGSVYFAPQETSINGKVVVPRTNCRYSKYDKISFDVKNGKKVNVNAGSNSACFESAAKAFTGQHDMFGAVWIGLNPGLKVVEDDKANFRHTNIAGLVSIGFGDNRQYGGSLTSVGGAFFNLTNATMTADGKTIVKDGKLVF